MIDGFYWGKFDSNLGIDGGNSGVVLVKGDVGYLFGFAFKVSAFDFGENPTPITPPQWLVEKLVQDE